MKPPRPITSIAEVSFTGADVVREILHHWLIDNRGLCAPDNPNIVSAVVEVKEALEAITNDTDAIVLRND